jgi:NADH-quinone oxidoreductase subunit G
MGHQLRQASLKGAKISLVNSVSFDANFKVAHEFTIAPAQMFKELKVLAKAALESSAQDAPEGLAALVASVKVTDEHKQCIAELSTAENSVVMLGTIIQAMPNYSAMRMLASFIADATSSTMSYLTPGANTSGAYLSGLLPNRTHISDNAFSHTDGLNTQAMFAENLKGYILYGIEAERDLDNPLQAKTALANADFVVSLSAYVSDAMQADSDVILPIAAITESSGTLINVDGTWQSFNAVSKANGLSKPGWKVLRVLGNLFNLDGFEYQSSEDVINELKSSASQTVTNKTNNQLSWVCPENISAQTTGMQRIAELSIYNVDALTRRATALQQTQDAQVDFAGINSALAKKLKIEDAQIVTAKQGDNSAEVTISIDDRITDNCVYLPAGNIAAASLGGGFDTIELIPA